MQQNYTRAEKEYLKVLDIDPENIKAAEKLSLLYSDFIKDKEKSLEFSKKVLKLRKDAYAMIDLAEDLLRLGKFQQSREQLDRALEEVADVRYQLIAKFLMLCSYFMENKNESRKDSELHNFINFYRN